MFMKVKGGISDVRWVELNDVMEIGIAQFLFFACEFSQVNDRDGGIKGELFIQVSAKSFMGLLMSCKTEMFS